MKRFVFIFGFAIAALLIFTVFQELFNVEPPIRPTAIAPRFEERKPVTYAIPQPRDNEPWAYQSKTDPAQTSPAQNPGGTALEIARSYLKSHREDLKIQPYHDLRPVEFKTPLGTTVIFTVFQDNLPLLNIEMSVQVTKELTIADVRGNYRPVKRANVNTPRMSPQEVLERIAYRYDPEPSSVAGATSVIYVHPESDKPELAYVLAVKDRGRKSNSVVQAIIRATDGQLLGRSVARE